MTLKHAGLLLLMFYSAYSYEFSGSPESDELAEDEWDGGVTDLDWAKMETGADENEETAPDADFFSASEPMAKSFPRSMTSTGNDLSNVFESEHEPMTQTPVGRAPAPGPSKPKGKQLPGFVIIPASKVQKEVFRPEKGARPVPSSVHDIFLTPSTGFSDSARPPVRRQLIDVLCLIDRMYVRVRRELFKTIDAFRYLKLGRCAVNSGNKEYYFLLYLLQSDCGFDKAFSADGIRVRTTLSFQPTTPVLRERPFVLPLQCDYPRFYRSYQVGFLPKIKGSTVFKALQPFSGDVLTPQDALGNVITGEKTYTLGQPMFFEAKRPGGIDSGKHRMYVKKCFITASSDCESRPRYTVIDNHGCMIDGKVTEQSKFLPGDSKLAQKFSIGAMIFSSSDLSSPSQQLYMHCQLYVGPLAPTPSLKACNYNAATKKWEALYGPDSMCACCSSSCPSDSTQASTKVISSQSWKVDFSHVEEDLEDPDMADKDVLENGEHDYEKIVL